MAPKESLQGQTGQALHPEGDSVNGQDSWKDHCERLHVQKWSQFVLVRQNSPTAPLSPTWVLESRGLQPVDSRLGRLWVASLTL